jgi:hypothetical protein
VGWYELTIVINVYGLQLYTYHHHHHCHPIVFSSRRANCFNLYFLYVLDPSDIDSHSRTSPCMLLWLINNTPHKGLWNSYIYLPHFILKTLGSSDSFITESHYQVKYRVPAPSALFWNSFVLITITTIIRYIYIYVYIYIYIYIYTTWNAHISMQSLDVFYKY